MISQKAKYALRALTALARAGETLQIAEIADAENIPRKFLEQILLDLKNRGIVASKRGAAGGYALLKPAEEIAFIDVLRAIDGPVAPLPCLSLTAYRRCDDCKSEARCALRNAFAPVIAAQRAHLERATIASALGRPLRRTVKRGGRRA